MISTTEKKHNLHLNQLRISFSKIQIKNFKIKKKSGLKKKPLFADFGSIKNFITPNFCQYN